MRPPSVVEKLDVQPSLDKPSEVVYNALEAAKTQVGEKVFDALHGEWMGHPLHPALTDVPVGAFTAAAIFDAVGADTAADASMVLGLASALPTAVTGLADWFAVKDERVGRTGVVHAAANTTALLLYGSSLVARKQGNRALGKGLGWLGFAVLTVGAYLGGHMVYHLGAGQTGQPGKV